jgi:hypothetical protein
VVFRGDDDDDGLHRRRCCCVDLCFCRGVCLQRRGVGAVSLVSGSLIAAIPRIGVCAARTFVCREGFCPVCVCVCMYENHYLYMHVLSGSLALRVFGLCVCACVCMCIIIYTCMY